MHFIGVACHDIIHSMCVKTNIINKMGCRQTCHNDKFSWVIVVPQIIVDRQYYRIKTYSTFATSPHCLQHKCHFHCGQQDDAAVVVGTHCVIVFVFFMHFCLDQTLMDYKLKFLCNISCSLFFSQAMNKYKYTFETYMWCCFSYYIIN